MFHFEMVEQNVCNQYTYYKTLDYPCTSCCKERLRERKGKQMTLGEKLFQLRKSKELSQEQLALKLSVSRQAISKWELNEAIPETINIIQLSKLFEVSIDYLLKEDFEKDNEINAQTDSVAENLFDHEPEITDTRYLPEWMTHYSKIPAIAFASSAVYMLISSFLNHWSFNLYGNSLLLVIAAMLWIASILLIKKMTLSTLNNPQNMRIRNPKMITVFIVCLCIPLAVNIYNLIFHSFTYFAHIILDICMLFPIIKFKKEYTSDKTQSKSHIAFIYRWIRWVSRFYLVIAICIITFALGFLLFYNWTPLTPFINILITALPYVPVIFFSMFIHENDS